MATDPRELERLKLKVELTKANADALLEEAEALNTNAKTQRDRAEAEQKAIEATQALIEFLETKADALEKSGNSAELVRRQISELSDATKKASDSLDKLKDALSESDKIAKQLVTPMAKLVGLSSELDESFAGTLRAALGTTEGLQDLEGQLKKTFNAANIAAGIFDNVIHKTIQLTMAQDQALASFAQNGGNVSRYSKDLLDLEQSMFSAGVTMDEAGEALLSLNRDFTDLRKSSTSTRTELAQTTAILQELGVASDVTVGNLQFMTKVLGTSAEQAAATQRELFVLARTIDMPPDAMASAFSDAMPKLAAFGSESTDVFKKLQVNAREAGMEVSNVLSIVENFDTFDSAAASVGRLNAILGGPFLDSLEMVTTTDPTERMRLLSDAVNDAGLSFDEMSYYQRKALADTMGMDIPQLALMMANGFDQAVPGAQQSQAEIVALAEEAKKFQNVMDELAQTGRLLATTMMPLVTLLKSVLNGIQLLVTNIPILEQILPPLALGITGVYLASKRLNEEIAMKNRGSLGFMVVAISLALAAMNAESMGAKIALGVLAIGAAGLALAMWKVAAAGTAASVATGGLLPVIGLIATGIMTLAGIFMHKAASPGFITILGMVGTAFKTLGMFMFPVVGIFTALTSAIKGSAKAAHDLDGTSVEMTTKTTAKAPASATGSLSSSGGTVTNTVARDSSGRIKSATAGAAEATAANARPSPQGGQATDVNVSVKADEGDLIKLIVKTIEQTNNYNNAGLRANPATVRNRI